MQAPAQTDPLPVIFSLEAAAASVAALLALAAALLVGSLTRRLLATIEGERIQTQPIANATVKVIRRVTFVLVLLVLLFPALEMAGVPIGAGFHRDQITQWL